MATYPHVFEPERGMMPPLSTSKSASMMEEAVSKSEREGMMPQFSFKLKGRWDADFFGNNNPIVLELGCGRGEYTVGLAQRYPDKNFIGIDIKGARMWTGATESLNEGMTNVAFVRTRIEFISRFFAQGEVAEIWLTFSDPQMKKPTKRLTSTYFLERYRRFLINDGLIHVKTDSNFLFTYTEYMLRENQLPVVCATRDLYSDEARQQLPQALIDVLQIKTYYEQQWLSRGLPIKFVSFHLPQSGQLREPDVEIELDDYRSYARSKRSSLTKAK